MTDSVPLLGPLLQRFFADHLVHYKRVSPQTVACYRDTFRLLLEFLQKEYHKEPSALRVSDLDVPRILSFLDHLERERKNSVRSRNLRLSAIRSFSRGVALREPRHVDLASRILAIPVERSERKLVGYLTRLEVEAILAAPNIPKWQGRRDYGMLLTLYNSGARFGTDRLGAKPSTLCHQQLPDALRQGPQTEDCPPVEQDGPSLAELVLGATGHVHYQGIS
jgi:integrase/recombinase XerD